jgi:putative restriction endonuclease
MLDQGEYQNILNNNGYVRTHQTKYATEFSQESSGELIYINRKSASSGLVIHPRHNHLMSRICAISEIQFCPGANHYKHNSNFRNFPKRVNDKDPIGYGLEFIAETKTAATELLRLLTESDEFTILDEIAEVEVTLGSVSNTERDAIIKARVGQGPWRSKLDSFWGNCALTDCDIREILRGSHIKPWKESSNEEKLDLYNGLLLRADVDALFDKGLLTFNEDGFVELSSHLTRAQQDALPFDRDIRLRRVPEESKKYFEYHRRKVFKGEA